MKALLALLLVLTQLFAWSGPALWLCLCGSGSACIVADAQSCECCLGHHAGEADACHDEEWCTSDRFLCEDDLLIGRTSGCPHIQLSYHQGAIVVSASFAKDAVDLIAFGVETAGPACSLAPVCDGRAADAWLSRAPIPPANERAGVVLQC